MEQAAVQNLPEFLKALSDVLVNVNNSLVARQAAGLQLKNHLTSKDVANNAQYQQRWLVFPEHIREYIKKNVSIRQIENARARPKMVHVKIFSNGGTIAKISI